MSEPIDLLGADTFDLFRELRRRGFLTVEDERVVTVPGGLDRHKKYTTGWLIVDEVQVGPAEMMEDE